MADNTGEVPLENPTNNQSENSPDDITPIAETDTTKPIQETENMEVHHHAHDPAVPHPKKNWKSYFWEFLMLFLAVFCGFLAEYQLEHKIEKDRAKEFAISLIRDLENDTTAMNLHKKTGDVYCSITDSLFLLSEAKLDGNNAAEFSFYTRFMYWTANMSWNRATFEQIKNSGGLRYFKNHELLQKLMKYNSLIENYEAEHENRIIRGNMMLTSINQIIEPQIHHELSTYRLLDLDTMNAETKKGFFTQKVESLENKRTIIKEMINMCIVQQRNIRYINTARLIPAKELAKELITDFKKEYDLE